MTAGLAKQSRALKGSILGALLLGIGVLAGCSGKKEVPKPTAMTVPVTVAVAERKDVPIDISAIGTVEAYNTVGIKSQVTGEITSVNFKEGDNVRKGQLLFTIDPRPGEADLRRAEATLAKDQATALNDKAQAARYAELFKQGVVSKQQADQMVTTANASEALVKADQAAVENAHVQLQYTKIYAPISGRTGNLMVQLGNVTKANPDSPIVTINQITPIYVTFTIPEQFLSEVKRYMAQRKLTVAATIPNDPQPATGLLTFIDNAVDTQTGTIKLKGTFENRGYRLWPGQFVNVDLTLAQQPNAIVVPTQAVQTGQSGQFIFVIKNGVAEMRPVDVARTINGQTIIARGIEPGDTVVTDGQLRLRPGTKVDIRSGGPVPTPGSQNAGGTHNQQQALNQD